MKTRRYSLRLKKAIVIIMALIVSTQLYSQTGNNAIGVRLGTDPGITYKHYFGGKGGVELMLHTGYRGLLFTGLYEWHLPFAGAPGLQGYLGVGAHIGSFNRWVVARRHPNGKVDYVYVDNGTPSFGPDFIMGIEYRIPGAPLDIGFDIKPGLDFWPRDYIIGTFNSAFSVRYRF